MSTVYLNGEWIDEEDAVIPADDRGFLYGDAVFETGRLVRRGFFRLDRHLDRLSASAVALDLPLPPLADLIAIACGLAERNAFVDATLRITLTRGGRAGPTLLATLTPLPGDWRETAARGWRIRTADVCHPPLACLPPIKTPGRLHGLLARSRARLAGADDGLLLTHEGDVCEGPSWNVFWRKGKTLFTPSAATGLLEGVTRWALMQLAPGLGYNVLEGTFPRAHLDDADEAFATMTSTGVVPFVSLDERPFDPGARLAASSLQEAYWELVESEAG